MTTRVAASLLSATLALGGGLLVSPTATVAASPADPSTRVPHERRTMPTTNCEAPVGYPLNATVSGYVVRERGGARTCVPIQEIPRVVNGPGQDQRVERATFDAALQALAQCRAEEDPCPADAAAAAYAPSTFRTTGSKDPVGLIDPYDDRVDLTQVRRPAYFAQEPYAEPIAEAESQTWTIDLAVPLDPYDRLSLGMRGRTDRKSVV